MTKCGDKKSRLNTEHKNKGERVASGEIVAASALLAPPLTGFLLYDTFPGGGGDGNHRTGHFPP